MLNIIIIAISAVIVVGAGAGLALKYYQPPFYQRSSQSIPSASSTDLKPIALIQPPIQPPALSGALATSTIKGRIIDVYPLALKDRSIFTFQTTSGEEEIVLYDGKPLAQYLRRGVEAVLIGADDRGIIFAGTLDFLPAGTLTFKQPLSVAENRQNSAEKIEASSFLAEWRTSDNLSKPAYLIFLSPEGQIQSPYFAGIPGAFYEVAGSLDNSDYALKASQMVYIPFLSKGLWTVKFVAVPGAAMSTVMGFTPGLPPKSLSERAGKLWYFKNLDINFLNRIENGLAECDLNCKNESARWFSQLPPEARELPEVFFFGKLAEPEIQKKLLGRAGTSYTLKGYRTAGTINYLGGLTCFKLVSDPNGIIKGSKLRLESWENGVFGREACRSGMTGSAVVKDQGKTLPVYYLVE